VLEKGFKSLQPFLNRYQAGNSSFYPSPESVKEGVFVPFNVLSVRMSGLCFANLLKMKIGA
jgi:hypothetical protein